MRPIQVLFVFLVCTRFFSIDASAQSLQPICQNFSTSDYIEDLEFHCAVADNKGTIYFGTNFGVLVYKGERKAKAKGWDFLLLPEADVIYSLYLDTAANRLYTGSETQLGYFDLKNYYSGSYTSLNKLVPDELKNLPVWHISKIKDQLVFHTTKGLLFYENNKMSKDLAPADGIYHNVFPVEQNKLLINSIENGWFMYDGKMKPVQGSNLLPKDKCYSVLATTVASEYTLFFRNAGVYKMKLAGETISEAKKISTADFDTFLSETQIYGAKYSADSKKIALATLSRGAFIIENSQMLGVQQIVSETSEATRVKSALGLFIDPQKNTWVLGKTNLSMLPSDLSLYYQELAGITVQDICRDKNALYVAAKNGLYKIVQTDSGPHSFTQLSKVVYKKIINVHDTLYCLNDYSLDRYVDGRVQELGFDFYVNDFLVADGKILLATETGIRMVAAGKLAGKTYMTDANVSQLVSFNGVFYATSEPGGLFELDKNLKLTRTFTFNNTFKTLQLAKLFVYNNELLLRNADNTFQLQGNALVPLVPLEVVKIWSLSAINSEQAYKFVYDDQNNTALFLKTGKEKDFEKVNSFMSSVEVNALAAYNGSYYIGTKKGLFVSPLITVKPKEKVNIFYFKTDSTSYPVDSSIVIPYTTSKNIEVSFAITGFYNKYDNTYYRYRLPGYDDAWKDQFLTQLTFNNLPVGTYTLEVMATYGNSQETEISKIAFKIQNPWWTSWWAITLGVVLFILFIYAIVQLSVYRLKQSKINLEKIVKERTSKIEAQKDEIQHKNKEITDSINYAQRIQSALLTEENYLQETFSNAFVMYQPKDIVSGDYYWFNRIHNTECIVVADCTGHGVPGAFMSMLGVAKLNEIKAEGVTLPDQILSRLNKLIFETLGQGKPNTDSRDGMDMAIITIDKESNTLKYAGANRSLIIVNRNDGTMQEIKATKIPVGGSQYGANRTYELHTVEIKPGLSFFLTTDGYADQFGGTSGKKFMTKKLNQLFVDLAGEPASVQKQRISDTYASWKADFEQVDDVCVFGINF